METVLLEVFLDLQKTYDALDRYRCLGIFLAAYWVGPRTSRIMRTCWGRLNIVARDGGYFGMLFKGYCGKTQGNPLPPNIFNVVVNAVIRYCVTVVWRQRRMAWSDLAC